jgi:ribosomal subunit interface protein
MKITIQSPHFEVGEYLTKLVTDKTKKLARFNERIIKAEVYLKFDKSGTDDDKVCEIKVVAPGEHLFASRKCLTFEEAINETVKALELQIAKKKTRWAGVDEKLNMAEEENTEEVE